jgi:hypothetical protein
MAKSAEILIPGAFTLFLSMSFFTGVDSSSITYVFEFFVSVYYRLKPLLFY